MTRKALLISTYDELTRSAKAIAKEIGLTLDVHRGGLMTDGHLYARDHQSEYDVVISQGGTSALVQEMVSKPTIAIHLAIEDYIRAFNTAKTYGEKVALVSYDCPLLQGVESLAGLIPDFDFTLFSYSSKQDFQQKLTQVADLKDHTVIGMGGCTSTSLLEKEGIEHYVMVTSSEEEIRNALVSAKNIIDLNYQDRLTANRIMNILNYSGEGIFCVDKKGGISVMNFSAEKMLGLTASTLIGKSITARSTPKILRDIYGNGSFLVDETVVSGPHAFIVKRIHLNVDQSIEETLVTFQSISDIQSLERKSRIAFKKAGLVAKKTLGDIVYKSPAMHQVLLQARHFASTEAVVLIEGETGTGKEIFAQGIHNASPRCNGPFVAINCAALPESLLESELFGYSDGAFTGARQGGKTGLFELANNGTIFLDEIGDISPLIQSRLLRVLQEKSVLPVGGDRIIDINARIIAATNKDLTALVHAGRFRSDLYYRLALLNLKLLPLRSRPLDIDAIARHFIEVKKGQYGVQYKGLSSKTLEAMCSYGWPGNVRELENFIERLIVLHPLGEDPDYAAIRLLKEKMGVLTIPGPGEDFETFPDQGAESGQIVLQIGSLKQMEREIFSKTLSLLDGNQSQTARVLGVSRVTLWKHLNADKPQDSQALPS